MNTLELNQLDVKLKAAFEHGSTKFANNPLHLKLRDTEETINDKLDFLPRMMFFVMGFKDLMQLVRYPDPQNEVETIINTHSDEDSHHWQWYLDDLSQLSLEFNSTESVDLISKVWKDETWKVRETIYLFGRHIQNQENPYARMLMVEVLELTFEKFKDSFHPVLKQYGLYEKLDYFGLKHEEMEEGHSAEIGHDAILDLIEKLPMDLKEPMVEIIDQLFDQMYQMTANWAEA